jgi:nucleoside-diphosphate-sugar epimerase
MLDSEDKVLPEKTQNLLKRIGEQRIFVTGATGFFGRSLLDLLLLNPNQEVTILSRNAGVFLKKWPRYKGLKKLRIVSGDVQTFDFLEAEFDSILHFATPVVTSLQNENPQKIQDQIVLGTKRILDFAHHAKAKNVLFTSSGAVYGKQPSSIEKISENYTETAKIDYNGFTYGESKRRAEFLGLAGSQKYGFNFKTARCFSFTGPHLDQKAHFAIGNFIRDALKNREIVISGDGTPLRSYLYSDDLIGWLMAILLDGKKGEFYNVGSDEVVSILALAEKVKSLLNPQIQIKVMGQKVEGILPERYVPSIEKAKSQLGVDIWTNLNEAIVHTAKKS